jgi:N-formylglutamate amidohydrolase
VLSEAAFCLHEEGDDPLVAAAIHDGHAVREEVLHALALTPEEHLREEDPFTGGWTELAGTRIVAVRSRFEVDLNRPREHAVYLSPADAWGLCVWNSPPAPALVRRSLAIYDSFYGAARDLLNRVCERFGTVLVYDLHSYNHRRNGPDAPPADPAHNPDVNVGTGSLDRDRWGVVVERFMETLAAFDFPGGRLDVRENVKFRGGHFSRWIHETFPGQACALAIEFKKIFMDEWTGEPDPTRREAVLAALRSTVPAVLAELRGT